ncbi:restriction endonuclease subunit S [Faecalibacterium prausnitzii]|uniref:Restriction endonuclease subunit S n=1 Tax=Faecalibacterium prausnitzii TaxID=853 RepID=A0A6A8KKX1_9FIRM|nr:restriction endonuclease subunit S [Faecalibacterium prausnitzii]MSC45425.1 restriction endonuclease subunit S [Faecalibacterium prausnitzii]MSC47766.1 restriction endonuclease subunit S [Faecalibacterium prausnitzii]MSC67509.1 restriction endonuclease subunit S [Faecalibacterium prausnitzii]MSC73512.1 restriction endonuclease subunit S [Faecalibacterium prausnitzii]MSC79735.1 restriction endonuclease subunit S [Faecalibacterium prausnitzii]
MKSEWQTVRAADFMDFNPRLSIKKGTVATKISMDKLRPFTKVVPSVEQAEFSGGTKFANGDTIMARITPCLENGKTAFVDCLKENEIAFGSTEFIVLRAKPGVSDSQFVYYLATSPEFRNVAIRSMVGSSGRQRVQQLVLENLELTVPKLPEQEKIGRFLAELDDKIALNERVNDNLYAQAKAIFSNYFINIDTIPTGWEKGSLLDIASYLNGLAMQKFRPDERETGLPVLKIKELRQGFCDADSELCSPGIKSEYIIKDGDVVFSWSGSLLVDIWCGGTCGLNQHLFKVTSKAYDKWFYYLWTAHHLDRFIAIAADKATTMGHIKREELAKAEVLIPSDIAYQNIRSIMNPIFDLIISNRIEAHRLAELRDELLPKLMSGELDVSSIKI